MTTITAATSSRMAGARSARLHPGHLPRDPLCGREAFGYFDFPDSERMPGGARRKHSFPVMPLKVKDDSEYIWQHGLGRSEKEGILVQHSAGGISRVCS